MDLYTLIQHTESCDRLLLLYNTVRISLYAIE